MGCGRVLPAKRRRISGPYSWLVGLALLGAGCQSHMAPVRTSALPPPPEPTVRHTTRLWLAFDRVAPVQCALPEGQRELCFQHVERSFGEALGRSLWTSFPSITELSPWDSPAPGDYVLRLELALTPVSPSAGGPGWAARAEGHFRLERDGVLLASERVSSSSRAEFGYGSLLGTAAGEVVDAIAVHIGGVLGALPEARPLAPRPLPPVVAESQAPPAEPRGEPPAPVSQETTTTRL